MAKPKEILVRIPIGKKIILDGDLVVPEKAIGIVLFAHGSGSSRFSPRNRYVAEVLQKSNIATLLMDLLTKEEEAIDAIMKIPLDRVLRMIKSGEISDSYTVSAIFLYLLHVEFSKVSN